MRSRGALAGAREGWHALWLLARDWPAADVAADKAGQRRVQAQDALPPLLGHLGAIASKHGRFEQAAAYQREAIDLRTRISGLAGLPRTYDDPAVGPCVQARGADQERGVTTFEDAAGELLADVRALQA